MNHSNVCLPALVCASVLCCVIADARAQESCDFNKLKARNVAHFVERTALNRAVPTYPDVAKRRGLWVKFEWQFLLTRMGMSRGLVR